jgi:hypothetical protein
MIVCSCTVITDAHIETALLEILNEPNAPIPTPGVVFRHLSKKMNCCGCAPLLVSTIYAIVKSLSAKSGFVPVPARAPRPDWSACSRRIGSRALWNLCVRQRTQWN